MCDFMQQDTEQSSKGFDNRSVVLYFRLLTRLIQLYSRAMLSRLVDVLGATRLKNETLTRMGAFDSLRPLTSN